MSQQSNFLISASAGTGKTFALASHIIRLLLAGEAPHNITALTFSRAAAAEIFNRVIKRLATAILSPQKASQEQNNILAPDCPEGVRTAILKRFPDGLSQASFLHILRDFLADQHRSQLGTIDSFLTRIVTLFPSEVGLEGPMTMLDEDAQAILRQQVVTSVFGSTDDDDFERLRLILEAQNDGDSLKTYLGQTVKSLEKGRSLLYKHLLPSAWGDPKTIFGAKDSDIVDFLTLDEDTASKGFQAALDSFVAEVKEKHLPAHGGPAAEYLQAFHTLLSESPSNITSDNTGIKNFREALYKEDIGHVTCGRKKIDQLYLPLPLVEQLKSLVRKAMCFILASKLRKIRGRYVMLMNLELAYQRLGPSQGKLDFSDITRLVAQNIASGANPNRSLEYRFDTLIRHLALDEFQDTSPLQWQSLLPVVNELKQSDDGRSLFVVGDLKQAIYGWRGGDYRLFKHELESNGYHKRDLSKSYRFRPEISTFVNTIFSKESMAELSASGTKHNIIDPCNLWGKFWATHSSIESEKEPEKRKEGYVHVERAQFVEEDPKSIEAVARLIYSRLAETQPWKRGLTSAILVRNNDNGKLLAQKILEIDPTIPIAFESQNPICDTPIISILLDLLVLSEHPLLTSYEWGHIHATESIVKTLYPDTSLFSIPRKIAKDRCKNGLTETLRVWSSLLLKAVPQEKKFDALRDRFESLISAAAEFSLDPNRSGTMLEFRDFVYSKKQRITASKNKVKILTQHRSKGLDFDQVFVPFFSYSSKEELSIGEHTKPLPPPLIEANDWVFPYVKELIRHSFPSLEHALKEQFDAKTFEEFCIFYVAVTRPKAELFIALPPEIKQEEKTQTKKKSPQTTTEKNKTWSFSLFLENRLKSLPYSLGNANWYTDNAIRDEKPANDDTPDVPDSEQTTTVEEEISGASIQRGQASHHIFQTAASNLFIMNENAAERGTSLHERLAQIEWLEPGVQPSGIAQDEIDFLRPSDLQRALLRPEGPATVWRERSFETLTTTTEKPMWTSGTVDRAVISGQGEDRILEIFDYKSNQQRQDESHEEFLARLKATYSPQLKIYRAALSTLTGIPKARIRCALLLTSTLERLDLN